jgi:ABC-type bacteriocin/lantibiotic exporter with double-glycine peptidase domain
VAAFVLVALTAAAAALRSRFTLTLQRRLDRHLTGGFFGHLVALPHVELERRGTGDLLSRMESLTLARLGLTSQVVNTLLDAGLLVVATGAIVARSPALGLVTAVGVAVQLVPLLVCARRLHEDTVRATMGEGAVHGFTAEALQGIATIKSLGAEGAAERRFRALAANRLDAEARRDRLAGRVEAVLISARTATPIAVLLAGLPGVVAQQMTIGRLIALVGLATAAVGPASSVVSGARSLQAVRSHLIRLSDLWAIEAEEAGGDVTLEGTVELRDVGVRYAGCRDWALRGVTMTIRPGEHIGVVGRSGSGKSTLVKVLAGLIAPTEGVVLVDGRPTTSLCPRALRQAVGVVLQDVWLFAGTIEENIVVDREGITTEALRRAAALAAIDTDIDELPLGYRTRLSDGGGGLSGGQRQRIAIARALATEPRVLIFDEATSNLDGTTEASVAAALDGVGATRFSVTHRLSTIRHCDHVVVFEGGRVVQQGRPEVLGAVDGPFRRFVVDSTHTASSAPRT